MDRVQDNHAPHSTTEQDKTPNDAALTNFLAALPVGAEVGRAELLCEFGVQLEPITGAFVEVAGGVCA